MFRPEIRVVRFAAIQRPSDFENFHDSSTPSSRAHNPNNIVCEFCGKQFERRMDLNRHNRTKHILPHRCEVCGKKFGLKSGLTRHLRNHDEFKTRIVCPLQRCGKGFSRTDHLARHIRKAHKGDTGSGSADNGESVKQALYEASEDAKRQARVSAPQREIPMRFLQAVVDGDVSKVKSLLSTDNTILESNDLGTKALRLAAQKGFEEVLSSLLVHYHGFVTPLNELAATGSETGVRLLFQYGAIPERSQGFLQAIQKGYIEIVQAYIDNGLDIYKDRKVLFHALKHDAEAIAKLLLQHGASLRHRTKGRIAVGELVSRGQSELLRMLLPQLSGLLEQRDLQLNLERACYLSEVDSASVVEALLEHCVKTNVQLSLGSLLLECIASDQRASSKLLLISDAVAKPMSALVAALKLAHSIDDRETKSLILANLDIISPVDTINDTVRAVEEKDLGMDDSTFLQVVELGHLETMRKLLDKGANAAAKNQHGNTCLMKALKQENLALMEILLDYGAEINEQDVNGRTALHYACDAPSEFRGQALKLLLSKGANVNLGAGERVGTPLTYAARIWLGSQKLLSLAEILTRHGADVNLSDSYGRTALILMSKDERCFEAIALLLKLGAEPNHQANNGNTALMSHCASMHPDPGSIRVFLEGGALIHIKNNEGQTALSIYCSKFEFGVCRNEADVIRLMLEHGDGIDPYSQTFTDALELTLRSRFNHERSVVGQVVDYICSYARSRDSDWLIPAGLHDDLRKHIERFSWYWETRTGHEFCGYLRNIREGNY